MKQLLFGNPYVDHIIFSLDEISVEEKVIEIDIALRAGFFAADLPLCLHPDHLLSFCEQVEEVDQVLSGSAVLHSKGANVFCDLTIKVLPLGHVRCHGKAEIDGNALTFGFETDQTQLGPLSKWIRGVIMKYETRKAARPA